MRELVECNRCGRRSTSGMVEGSCTNVASCNRRLRRADKEQPEAEPTGEPR